MPRNLIFVAPYLILSKCALSIDSHPLRIDELDLAVYTNAYLAALNSRESLRERATSDDGFVSVRLSRIAGSPPVQSADTEQSSKVRHQGTLPLVQAELKALMSRLLLEKRYACALISIRSASETLKRPSHPSRTRRSERRASPNSKYHLSPSISGFPTESCIGPKRTIHPLLSVMARVVYILEGSLQHME